MATSSGAVPPKKPTLTEQVRELRDDLALALDRRDQLGEALTRAVAMLRQEDVGWAAPGNSLAHGLSLSDLKKWSADIRTSYTGTREKAPNPHIRNGFMLRAGYIWDGDLHYDGIPAARRGATSVQAILDRPINKRLFTGTSARRRREMALFADGAFFVVGSVPDGARSKTQASLRPVPLEQITDVQIDETYGEVIAYRWTKPDTAVTFFNPLAAPPTGTNSDESARSSWIYVDWWDEAKPKRIKYQGFEEPVEQDSVMFDLLPNRAEGFRFGSPDAIAAVVWARVIRDLIMNGVKMQDALAMFAFSVSANSTQGQKAVAMELGAPAAAANAAVGTNQSLVPLSTAGRGYDFSSLRFVVATMAASLHVSGIALSADTSFAGSSYGAAKTLDLPTRLAMQSRRDEHVEFDKRVLAWLGAPDAVVYFNPYDDEVAMYRAVQGAMLAWSSGVMTPEAFRAELERIFGHAFLGAIPDGVITPNNNDTDGDGEPGGEEPATGAQQGSANQGRSTGNGKGPRDSDLEQPKED